MYTSAKAQIGRTGNERGGSMWWRENEWRFASSNKKNNIFLGLAIIFIGCDNIALKLLSCGNMATSLQPNKTGCKSINSFRGKIESEHTWNNNNNNPVLQYEIITSLLGQRWNRTSVYIIYLEKYLQGKIRVVIVLNTWTFVFQKSLANLRFCIKAV